MDFTFSDEEQEVGRLARTILGDLVTNERLRELEATPGGWDEQVWGTLAEADLLGVGIPGDDGGSGAGFLALCRLLGEVGRHVALVPAQAALVSGALALAEFGAGPERAWLAEIAGGQRLVSAALEDASSSDPLAPATRAEGSGTGIRLTGVRVDVAYAAQASHVLVPARCDEGGVGLFWVAPNADGVVLAAQRTPDGQPRARMGLDGATPSGRLDRDGRGQEMLRWLVERATAAVCMTQLGVLERAVEMTAAYARERVQFERPIGSFQAVHQRAADAYIALEAVRMTAWEAAWRLSAGLPATEHVLVAKYLAAELGQSVSFACQHLHGGIGIDTDYPLHRYFRWATQLEHELGSARHQLDRLGQMVAAGDLQPA